MSWLLLLLACGSPDPAPELVLYLRDDPPAAGSAFGRVNPRTFDLGSLSAAPPAQVELRACGDVVAFAGQPGLVEPGALPADGVEVREVLYRLWWTSGVGRGVLSLWSPQQGGGLAVHPVSSCAVPDDDPRHQAGFFQTTARVPVGRRLSEADLAGLHVLLDVAGAQVVVGSCPGRASLVILNPPSDAELARRDSDGDGHDDLSELHGGGDPFRADDGGASATCLRHADPVATVPHCPVPTDVGEARPAPRIEGTERWEAQRLRLQGTLQVAGALEIAGGTVLFEAAPGSGSPGIEVLPGGALTVSAGAVLGAADPAVGFHLAARPGSTLRLVDSTLRHVGTLEIDPQGYARWQGVQVETAAAELRGNTFQWGLAGVELLAPGVAVEGNRFEHSGTAVQVRAPAARVEGNHAVGGGSFVRVDDVGGGALVRGNHLEGTVDIGIKVVPGARGVVIEGNRLDHVHQGIEFRGVEELTLRDNTMQACIQPFLPLLAEAGPGVVAEGNTLLAPDPRRCRVVLPANQPDPYPGDVQRPRGP